MSMDIDNQVCVVTTEDLNVQGDKIPKGTLCTAEITADLNVLKSTETVNVISLDEANKVYSVPGSKLMYVIPAIRKYLTHGTMKKSPEKRIIVLNDPNWIQDALDLSVGDRVNLYKVNGMPDGSQGILKFKDTVQGVQGIYFGVLLDPALHGQGTSNGTFRKIKFFQCDDDCAVFVSIYNIRSTWSQTSEIPIAYPPMHSSFSSDATGPNNTLQHQNQIKRPDKSSDMGSSISDSGMDYSSTSFPLLYPPQQIPAGMIAGGASKGHPVSYSNETSEYVDPQVPLRTPQQHDRKPPAAQNASSSSSSMPSLAVNLHGPEELPIKIGERVVWVSDEGVHKGVVRWVGGPGELDEEEDKVTAGVELDEPVGTGSGTYKGKRLFKTKKNHAALMPILGLVKEKDFFGTEPTTSLDDEYEKDLALALRQSTLDSQISRPPQNIELTMKEDQSIHSFLGEGVRRKKMAKTPSTNITSNTFGLYVGSRVRVLKNKYGEIRWIGTSPSAPDPNKLMAGILMEGKDANCYTDGTFQGEKFFDAPPHRAFFIYLHHCQPDDRQARLNDSLLTKSSSHNSVMESRHKTQGETNSSEGQMSLAENLPQTSGIKMKPSHYQDASSVSSLGSFSSLPHVDNSMQLLKLVGKSKGIEGEGGLSALANLLYLWFQFINCFDSKISRKKTAGDVACYNRVCSILGKGVLHQLRSSGFVPKQTMQDLFAILDYFSKQLRKVSASKMKPNDFIDLLLKDILRVPALLKLDNNNGDEFNSIIIEQQSTLTAVSIAIANFCGMKKALFASMPDILHVVSAQGMMCPELKIDLKPFLSGLSQNCGICGRDGTIQCFDCYVKGSDEGFDATYFCKICSNKKHGNRKFSNHQPYQMTASTSPIMLSYNMCLSGLLCYQRDKHYVCYAKCSQEEGAAWVKFDSMGERGHKGHIPVVTQSSMLPIWLEAPAFDTPASIDKDFHKICKDAILCLYVREVTRES